MASRKKPAKKNTNRAGKERSTGSYAHPETSALLRPEAGTQAQFRKKKPPATWRYDPSLSPTLDWTGKAERLSLDVPTLPLFVHERLSTAAILETLKGYTRDRQVDMFDLFGESGLPIRDRLLKAYEHRNRSGRRLAALVGRGCRCAEDWLDRCARVFVTPLSKFTHKRNVASRWPMSAHRFRSSSTAWRRPPNG